MTPMISTIRKHQMAYLALIGMVIPGVALSQDMIEELKEEFTPDCLISDDYVPDIIGDTEFVQSGRDSGVFCQPVAEEEFVPAPEGLEPWAPHGIIAENEANDALVEEMMENESMFDFESMLPASRFFSDEEEEAEPDIYGNEFGMEDPILDQPVRYDPSLDEQSQNQTFDFDAEMASSRTYQPSTSLEETFADRANPAQASPVELGDIHEGRRQIALTEARDRFRAEDSRIRSECQCVSNGSSCFSAPSYNYDQLNQTVATAQADFNSQQNNVCRRYQNWITDIDVEQLDTVTKIDSVLGIARTVTNDLNSLDDANSRVLADMSNTQAQIAAEIRAEEQRRQQALAQQQAAQNSGPSGWQVFGQVLQQVGAEVGDIYAEVGGAFVQDVASGGSTSALANTYQRYNTGSYDYGYDIQSTGYGTYDAYTVGGSPSYDSSYGSAMDNVLVYGADQNQVPDYGAPSAIGSAGGASGGGRGQYGIALYRTDINSNWVYILSSQESSTHAYANAFNNCGSVCSGTNLHVEFGPGQCIAFVGGQDDNGFFRRTYEISSSSSGAQNAALNTCQSYFQDRIRRGEDLEYSCNVVASACN